MPMTVWSLSFLKFAMQVFIILVWSLNAFSEQSYNHKLYMTIVIAITKCSDVITASYTFMGNLHIFTSDYVKY